MRSLSFAQIPVLVALAMAQLTLRCFFPFEMLRVIALLN